MAGPAMPVDYEYDVFVSYRHTYPSGPFVTNVLFRLFEGWLTEALEGARSRIFLDESEMGAGDNLPNALAAKLRLSKCLLAVCTPSYFRQPWCLAEWHSFREREQSFNAELIVPLLFDKRGPVMEHVGQTLFADFTEYTYITDALLNSQKGIEFQDKVKRLAEDVAAKVEAAIPFQPVFPILMPERPPLPAPVGLLRLSEAHLVAAGGVA